MKEDKVSFKDLTMPLKASIIAGWLIIGIWVIALLVGIIEGIIGV